MDGFCEGTVELTFSCAMNRATLTAAGFACALLGWWLPGLWQREAERKSSRVPRSLPMAPALSAEQSLKSQVRLAGSAMAQFQAVVAALEGRGASFAFLKGAITGLTCEEAEELAAALAGEEFGRSVTDGPALLRSFKDMDYRTACAALAAWSEESPDAAIRTLLTPEGMRFSDSGALQRLAERDPAKALEILRAAPNNALLQSGWRVVLAACAEKGPDFALAAVQSAPEYAKPGGVNAILRVLALTDPQAALTWMDALPAGLRAGADKAAVFRVWAKADPAAALPLWRAADEESFAGESGYHFEQWSSKDPEAALRWAGQNPSLMTGQFISLCMQSLSRRDPQRAVGLLDRMEPAHRQSAISGLAGHWPAADFASAFTWARGLTNASERDTALEMLAGSARQMSGVERRAYVDAVGAATPAGFGMLMDLDRPAALQTFATLPAEQQRELWKRVGQDLASHSPADAAQFLRNLSPATGEDALNAGNVAGEHGKLAASWVHSDPEAAASWVESLPPGDPQKWAALNLVANWSRHDPAAAAAWTRRLPPGPARNVAEEQLAANAVRAP
jgi:hypothetical protein